MCVLAMTFSYETRQFVHHAVKYDEANNINKHIAVRKIILDYG